MNKKGFTLVELLAVIVILAVIILIAINAVLPQMARARKNSFADEVLNYGKAAENAYVNNDMEEELKEGENINTGICFELSDLHGEYVTKNDTTYKGIVVLKKNNETETAQKKNLYMRFVYLASGKFVFNSTTKTEGLTSAKSLKKISGKDVNDGNSANLSYQTCCDWEKSTNGYNDSNNSHPSCTIYPAE